jgi:hypothetical protein
MIRQFYFSLNLWTTLPNAPQFRQRLYGRMPSHPRSLSTLGIILELFSCILSGKISIYNVLLPKSHAMQERISQ